LALTGDDNFIGFEAIKDQYGMTKTANLTNAYIGLCYKELGQFDKAAEALKDFNANDEMISPSVIVALGDCYVEMGKVKESIDYFLKAADKADNDLVSPIALKKAAIAYEELKDYEKAVNTYTLIQEKYYNSQEGREMQKYIDRANALKASK
jgi:tetratricopeptide (TPR) repeat protein